MSSKRLVLVTGANGFAGAHIVEHLLRAGYAVRGTCRDERFNELKKLYTTPDFHVVIVNDIVQGDLSAALEGVYAVIHNAAPLPNSQEDIMKIVLESTMNVLRQVQAAQIHKVVILGSMAATMNGRSSASRTVTSEDWNPAADEDANRTGLSRMEEYSIAKTLAERNAWKFAESHPDMDLTTLLPAYYFGPSASGQVVTDGKTLSSNIWIYQLISGTDGKYPQSGIPYYVDIRDVARAAVVSLEAPPASPGKRKRIILVGGHFWWEDVVRHIASVRPELRGRLLGNGDPLPEEHPPAATFDTRDAKEILGIKEFTSWKRTVEETVDDILEREPGWDFAAFPRSN